jgi:D-methionine transport system substrate-binding protein
MRRLLQSLAASTAAIAVAALAGCSNPSTEATDPNAPLVVGASSVPHAQVLRYVEQQLAPEAGLKLRIVEFSDFVQPNLKLGDGELGANYFQHRPYMTDFAGQHGLKLAFVAGVHLEPLGLYSKKVKSVRSLPTGASLAVPKDATNLGRALRLLAAQGLITLKPGVDQPTERDVAANPRDLRLRLLEAAQIPRSLADLDAAVINGNYALQAKLNPAKDALVLESSERNPYVNGLVTLADRAQDPRVVKLAGLLRSAKVRQFITARYQGSVLPAA